MTFTARRVHDVTSTGWTRAAAGAALIGLLALGGCSSSIKDVSKDKVATQVTEKISAKTGTKVAKTVCEKDLAAKVGATTRCTLTADDKSTVGATVTVSTVKGKTVNFDIQVDPKVTPAPSSTS